MAAAPRRAGSSSAPRARADRRTAPAAPRGSAAARRGSAARAGSRPAGRTRPGTTPAIERSRRRPVLRSGSAGEQRLGVRDGAAPRTARGTGAGLDDLAGVHHEHALRDFGDDAEVVRDQHERHAALALQLQQQREHLRLDRDVERGRRLVGDQQARVAGDRHREHHALAHAARELVREGVEAALRRPESRRPQQLRARARAAPCASRLRAGASVSISWNATVKHGFRLVIGSWKIIAMSRPSSARRSRSRIACRSRPSNGEPLGAARGRARRPGPSARARSRSCPTPIRRRCRRPRRRRPRS